MRAHDPEPISGTSDPVSAPSGPLPSSGRLRQLSVLALQAVLVAVGVVSITAGPLWAAEESGDGKLRLHEIRDPVCETETAGAPSKVISRLECEACKPAAPAGSKWEPLDPEKVVIPLDNTGVADWDYLNRRRPFPLVHPPHRVFEPRTDVSEGCFKAALPLVTIEFENRTVDRTFVINVPFEYPLPGGELADLLRELRLQITFALIDQLTSLREEALNRLSRSPALAGEGLQAIEPEAALDDPRIRAQFKKELTDGTPEAVSVDELRALVDSLEAPVTGTLANARKLREELERNNQDPELQAKLRALEESETSPNRDLKKKLADRLAREEAVQDLDFIERTDRQIAEMKDQLLRDAMVSTPPPARAQDKLAAETGSKSRIRQLADALSPGGGIGDPCQRASTALSQAFTSKDLETLRLCRQQVQQAIPEVAPNTTPTEPLGEPATTAAKVFFERLTDTEQSVALIAGQAPPGGSAFSLTEPCKRDNQILKCTATLTVPPNGFQQLNGDFLPLLPKGAVVFNVRFFDEVVPPSNAAGFLATVPAPKEPPSSTAWTLNGQIGWARDPDLTTDPDPEHDPVITQFSASNPYDGAQRSRFFGSASADLVRTLGNRADGTVSFAFKQGDLGGEDKTRTTNVPTYKLNVYALSGLALRFGKYAFATPASKLAVNEGGEGVELRYRWFSLGHIVKRESTAGISNRDNDDSEVTLLQANNISPGSNSFLRSANFIALQGEDKKADFKYQTLGAEVFVASPASHVTGSFAYYQSEKESNKDHGGPEAEGSTALVTGTYAVLKSDPVKRTTRTQRTFTVQAGMGTGNDRATNDLDEGYIGETASFAPDVLFLSSLAGKIDTENQGKLEAGLSNKQYAGFIYTDYGFSPLSGIAQLLRTGDKIVSEKMSIGYHLYRFDEKVFGVKDAGSEVDVEFQIEVPGGITGKVTMAYYFPGRAIETTFKKDPWAIVTSLSIKMDG